MTPIYSAELYVIKTVNGIETDEHDAIREHESQGGDGGYRGKTECCGEEDVVLRGLREVHVKRLAVAVIAREEAEARKIGEMRG